MCFNEYLSYIGRDPIFVCVPVDYQEKRETNECVCVRACVFVTERNEAPSPQINVKKTRVLRFSSADPTPHTTTTLAFQHTTRTQHSPLATFTINFKDINGPILVAQPALHFHKCQVLPLASPGLHFVSITGQSPLMKVHILTAR